MVKKIKMGAIVVLIFAFFISLGIFLIKVDAFKNWFTISGINITGNNYTLNTEILKVSGLKDGSALYGLNIDSCGIEIMKLPYVKGVSISRLFPDELIINISEHQPIASVWIKGEWLLLSEAGTILPLINEIDLGKMPVINIETFKAGKNEIKEKNEKLMHAFSFVEELFSKHAVVYAFAGEINLAAKDRIEIILIKGDAKVIINKKNYGPQLEKLKLFLQSGENIDFLKHGDYINLLFEDRIIIKKA